jgi:ubiquinone/menaquinone biosynthesis C-methylase UbiE
MKSFLLRRGKSAAGRIRRAIHTYLTNYRHTGERVCPDFPDANFENHLKVYRFATQFIGNAKVLDVGCGTGYGSAFLAGKGAGSVVGIDFSDTAIAYAKKKYRRLPVQFEKMDAQALRFPDRSFDFVLSSENLEHLADPSANVREMRRVLREGGLLLLGTPNKEMFSPGRIESPNPFHLKEFYFEELRDLLLASFATVHLFENTLESEFAIGRQMKTARVARGAHGINWLGQSSIVLDGQSVNLEHMHNTHSFIALAR